MTVWIVHVYFSPCYGNWFIQVLLFIVTTMNTTFNIIPYNVWMIGVVSSMLVMYNSITCECGYLLILTICVRATVTWKLDAIKMTSLKNHPQCHFAMFISDIMEKIETD